MANQAGTAYVDVHPELRGFGKELTRGIDPHIDQTSSRITSKMGGAFKAVAGIAGGIFVGSKLFELGGDLMKLGTQVDTFGKKAKTVFESSNADVTKWAKANASAFGVTDDALAGLAANFGDLLKPMGFTAAQAADMSTQVVGLSGALSAWSGGTRTAAEVSQILAKAMLGERDSLKELGISISEADVQARLLTKGQKDLTGSALEQAKAIATQELIFEKSADAQKAWADGSLDAVKKQNALKEKIGELKEDLAEKLRPAFAGVVGFVVDKFIPGMERVGRTVGPIAKEIVKDISLGLGGLRSAFSGEGVTSDGFVGVMERIGVAARAVVDWFRDNWPEIKLTISETLVTAQAVISGFVDVVRTIWNNFGEQLVAFAQSRWDAIKGVIQGALDVIQGIVQIVTGIIHGDWSRVWDGIRQIVAGAWETIKALVQAGIDNVKLVVSVGLEIIASAWSRVWNGIKGFFMDLWEGLKNIVRSGIAAVVDFFLAGVERILEGGARMLGWVPGLGEKLREARDAFRVFRDSVNDSLGGIDDKTIQLFLKANDRNLGTAGDPIYANTGRLVPGQGNSDTVPAWLTPGEFVIRKKAVQALGVPYLEQLNAQGYASGGLVDFQWHLPGVGGIRDAAQGMFDDMAASAAEVFRAKAQEAADQRAATQASGGGSVGGGTHVGTSYEGILAALDRAGQDYTVTSAYRPGDPGFHGRGKAVDLVGDMAAIFHTIAGFSGVNELFFDPIGWYLDEGSRHSGAIGGHDDHVHAATFHAGGIVPGSLGQDRLAVVEAGERISPVGETIDYDKLGRAVAAALREQPPVVRVADVARGLHQARPR